MDALCHNLPSWSIRPREPTSSTDLWDILLCYAAFNLLLSIRCQHLCQRTIRFFRCSIFQINPFPLLLSPFLAFSSVCVQTVSYSIKSLLWFPLRSCHVSVPSHGSPFSWLLFNPSSAIVRVHTFFPAPLPLPSVLYLVAAPSDVKNVLSYLSSEVRSGSLPFSMLCQMNYICELQHWEICSFNYWRYLLISFSCYVCICVVSPVRFSLPCHLLHFSL